MLSRLHSSRLSAPCRRDRSCPSRPGPSCPWPSTPPRARPRRADSQSRRWRRCARERGPRRTAGAPRDRSRRRMWLPRPGRSRPLRVAPLLPKRRDADAADHPADGDDAGARQVRPCTRRACPRKYLSVERGCPMSMCPVSRSCTLTGLYNATLVSADTLSLSLRPRQPTRAPPPHRAPHARPSGSLVFETRLDIFYDISTAVFSILFITSIVDNSLAGNKI